MIVIRRPGCARSFSHFIDASGRLDLHRTDDDRASASLIGDDRDHDLPDRDRTVTRRDRKVIDFTRSRVKN